MDEVAKFQAWWESKGTNSVISRAQAWSAWLARAEAEQPQPAEDPDEWVIQDRVPMRDVVDQGRYQLKETRPSHDAIWYALSDMNMKTRGLMHGATHPYDPNCMLFVRCRRRDLPKVEPKTTDDFGMYLESVIAKDTQLKAEVDAAEAELAEIDARLNEQVEQWPKYWTTCDATKFAYVEQVDESSAKYVRKDGSHIVAQWGMAELRKQLTEAGAMALLKKPEPQPQKTRVRLWLEGATKMVMCRDKAPYGDWQELHHDSEGFYVEKHP